MNTIWEKRYMTRLKYCDKWPNMMNQCTWWIGQTHIALRNECIISQQRRTTTAHLWSQTQRFTSIFRQNRTYRHANIDCTCTLGRFHVQFHLYCVCNRRFYVNVLHKEDRQWNVTNLPYNTKRPVSNGSIWLSVLGRNHLIIWYSHCRCQNRPLGGGLGRSPLERHHVSRVVSLTNHRHCLNHPALGCRKIIWIAGFITYACPKAWFSVRWKSLLVLWRVWWLYAGENQQNKPKKWRAREHWLTRRTSEASTQRGSRDHALRSQDSLHRGFLLRPLLFLAFLWIYVGKWFQSRLCQLNDCILFLSRYE